MIFEDTTYEQNAFVTKDNAEFRASIVSDCTYDVTLALPKGEVYFGTCSASFTLSEIPTKPLYLDLRAVKIGNLLINGQAVTEPNSFTDHHIYLHSKYLQVGRNTV